MNRICIILLSIILPIQTYAQWEVKNVDELNAQTIMVLKLYDNQTGFAMGSHGLILKTTNAGETWENSTIENIGTISDFTFLSLDTLLFVSTEFDRQTFTRKIYKSDNLGESWREVFSEEGDISCIQAISSNELLASGFNRIFRSADGGESWEIVYDLENEGFRFGEISRFEFIDELNGFAVGLGLYDDGSNIGGFFLKTTNGGLTWDIFSEFDSWLTEIDFVNSNLGYISDGVITLKTNNGGVQWDTLSNLGSVVDFATPSVNKILTVNRPGAYFPEAETTIFAINESNDQGLSWTGEFKNGAHLESIYFISDSVGFVAGDYSIIMKTETSGGEIIGDYPWHLFQTSSTNEETTFLSVYPNPVVNNAYLKLEHPENWYYTITSSTGHVMLNGKLQESKIEISNLPSGLYYLSLQKANKIKIAKLIKN